MRLHAGADAAPPTLLRCRICPLSIALDPRQDIDEHAGVAAVHEAFALGINLFDTSPFYGSTRSETVRASTGSSLMGIGSAPPDVSAPLPSVTARVGTSCYDSKTRTHQGRV